MSRLALRSQQLAGFFYRDFAISRAEWSWVAVFTFYALVNSATIALIGIAAHNDMLTLNLVLGAALWSFLSVLFSEIAQSIAFERWDGTLEFTFMSPAPRIIHLAGVSLYAAIYACLRLVLVVLGLGLLLPVHLTSMNIPGLILVLIISSFAFTGLGLIAATLPVFSPSRGAEATNILQGVLLLVSGIYYSTDVLPSWIRPLSVLSPATYALKASRVLIGIDSSRHSISIPAVWPELLVLLAMGLVLVPLGLWVFGQVERWAKRTGKLKRTG